MYIGKIETGRSYKKFVMLFVGLSVLLIAIVIYATISQATITLTPTTTITPLDLDIRVASDPSLQLKNTVQGRIVEREVTQTKRITDVAEKGVDQNAKGTVTITNKRGESQPLLPKTQLQAPNGLIYRTDRAVSVPARGSVDVSVTCDTPGKEGEIGPSHFIVIKLWQGWHDLIFGDSKEAMTGGFAQKKIVTQEEMDAAQNTFLDELTTTTLKNLEADLQEGEALSAQGVQKEILSSEKSVKPGDEASDFTIALKVKFSVVIFDETGLKNLMIENLKSKLPEGKEYADYQKDTFKYTVTSVDRQAGSAVLKAHLDGLIVPKFSPDLFDKGKLIGRSPAEVKRYFEKYPDIQRVEIHLSPFWVKSVPSLKDHIEITIATPVS